MNGEIKILVTFSQITVCVPVSTVNHDKDNHVFCFTTCNADIFH